MKTQMMQFRVTDEEKDLIEKCAKKARMTVSEYIRACMLMEMVVDGELQGRTVQSFLRPGEQPDARCVRCEGERKNQPMLGMVILWGLRPDGADWQGGHVLDPTTGRTYRASVTLIEGGAKLRVRGFIGLSLFGRSQTWMRLE